MNYLKWISLILPLLSPTARAATPFADCHGALGLPTQIVGRLKQASPAPSFDPTPRLQQEIATADAPDRILADLRDHARVLIDTKPGNDEKGYVVYLATGREIPIAMREVARAREETFRTVGEGTGRDLDQDRFDPYYLQLICWDKRDRAVTGAYRLGKADDIIREHGVKGLYSNSLFEFKKKIVREFSERTLEVGRSFVRPQYQKGLTLALLWSGIARFLAENPWYRHLIGPVSISGDFNDRSRLIISQFLMKQFMDPRTREVRPRTPPRFHTKLTRADLEYLMRHVNSLDHLQQTVRLAEDNEMIKLPPLIKIYLELDVKFLAFNWDAEFNALDGLISTDVTKLPLTIHRKYMGEEAAAAYRAANGLD